MSLENKSLFVEKEKTKNDLFKEIKILENMFNNFGEKNYSDKNHSSTINGINWKMERADQLYTFTFKLFKEGRVAASLTINRGDHAILYSLPGVSRGDDTGGADDKKNISLIIDKFKKNITDYYKDHPDKLIKDKKAAAEDRKERQKEEKKGKINILKAINNLGSINVLDPEKMLEDMA